MSNLVILKWWHFEDKAKFEKDGLFSLGPKQVFVAYFLKDKESFEDLEFSSN